jgi:PAS domain S-box-containing protein
MKSPPKKSPSEEELGRLRARVAELEATNANQEHTVAQLRESEARVRDFYDDAPDMFATVDSATGLILECNRTLLENIGYTKEEIVGRKIRELYHETSEADRQEVFKTFLEVGVVRDAELTLRRKDGTKLEVSLNISALRDEKGDIIRSRSIWRDIREKKAQAQELAELNHIYDSTTVGLCLMDTNLRYIRINKWLANINGVSPKEHIGRTLREIVPQIADSMEPVYEKVLESGEPAIDIQASGATAAHPDTVHHYLANYYPLKTDDGKIWGLGSIVRDVTLQFELEKELRASHEQTRAILDNALHAIVSINEKGLINSFNPGAEKLFGHLTNEVLGENIGILMPEPDRGKHDEHLATYLRTGNSKIIGTEREVLGKRRDGSTFPMLIAVSEYFVESGRRFVATIHDLTQRKKFETDLASAKETAEKANQSKNHFLSSMSHELRTPLNGILRFSEVLGQELNGPLNERQQECVNFIERSGEHLLELITDLLDLSKIDAGVVELNAGEVSVDLLLETGKKTVKGSLRDKELTIDVEVEANLKASGDARRCQQVLLNLLSNAVKYAPQGGHIKLRGTRRDDYFIQISVSDTGPGIPAAQQASLFSEFYQADRVRDEALGGSGIGLALCRRLVNLHGGEIGVESDLGVGSTFWFTLPVWEEVSSPAVEENLPKPEKRKMPEPRLILVVDDDAAGAFLLTSFLSVHNHEVVVARNGQEAIEMALSLNPALIFMDTNMPVMGGLEATRRLIKTDKKDIPIVALTASADDANKQDWKEAGSAEFLTKPIRSQEVFDTLERIL